MVMEKDVQDYFDELDLAKEVLRTVDKGRRETEGKLKMLQKKREEIKLRIDIIENKIIPVRFGDLLTELSSLLGIKPDQLKAELFLDMAYYKRKPITPGILRKIVNTYYSSQLIYVIASDDGNIKYSGITAPSELDEEQLDGKSLREHCGLEVKEPMLVNTPFKMPALTDIDDVILKLKISTLRQREDENYFYPKNLFIRAVDRCNLRRKDVKHKVRKLDSDGNKKD